MTMDGETRVTSDMELRLIEVDDDALVTVDGPFESRTFRISLEDAVMFAAAKPLDCRAIVFRSDRGGGDLRALYPWTYGEWQVRYDLRALCRDTSSPVATIDTVDDPLDDEELKDRWTVVWNDGE